MSRRSSRSRTRRRNRGRFGPLFKLLCVLAVIVALTGGATVFFRVETVMVTGSQRYTQEEIIAASGIQVGDNLYGLNKVRIDQNIRTSLPYIGDLTINRALPSTIVITVVEWEATAQVSVPDPDRVAGALRSALSALPVNEDRVDPVCDVRVTAGPEPIVVEETMDVTQGKLALGFRTGGLTCWEEEYPALYLATAVFGGTTLSKLFMNVREKLSLCYYASATLERMKGLVLVSSGIEFDKYETARNEILAQLEAVKRGEIEDWELEGSRRTLISACMTTLDEQSRQEEFWLGQAAAGLEESPEEFAARLEAVTREQVAVAAQKWELDTVYFLKGKEG